MDIPVINMDQAAAKDGIVLASFGVDFRHVGKRAAELVEHQLLKKSIKEHMIFYPKSDGHKAVISKQQAVRYGIHFDHIESLRVES